MRIGNITMLFAALICATAAALLSRAWLKGQAGGERVLATTQQEAPRAVNKLFEGSNQGKLIIKVSE